MASQRQSGSVERTKARSHKAFVFKLNLSVLITFFILSYIILIFHFPEKFNKEQTVKAMQTTKEGLPSLEQELRSDMRIGTVNMKGDQAQRWRKVGQVVEVEFKKVSDDIQWKDLYPEWIDEEEENEVPKCPNLPMPNMQRYKVLEIVVVELPCRFPTKGWSRDVWRLQVHLAAAKAAVEKGRRDGNGKVRVAARSACRPMIDVFRCDDLVRREGEWWLFEVDVDRLKRKLALPVGSCRLAIPFQVPKNNNQLHETPSKREAYATVIHSSSSYICGAFTLAQSLLLSGTNRDLILLHDDSIPTPTLVVLAAAGWSLHLIERIRNPHAAKNIYNEYNYSKFRLWQLTHYSKLIFIDLDIIVLHNLDHLFDMPQLTAIGNDKFIFNSGMMVIEPSNCTFKLLMESRDKIFSYNGGDQGFLNEVFVWWHRLSRRVNFMKINVVAKNRNKKEQLFASDPPVLYTIHFLGVKPWRCYRDYDCNWNFGSHRRFASDAAHRQWWMVHDQMDDKFKSFCGLSKWRKQTLQKDLKNAKKEMFADGHWKINITDPRQFQ